jgi:hypothetical protein
MLRVIDLCGEEGSPERVVGSVHRGAGAVLVCPGAETGIPRLNLEAAGDAVEARKARGRGAPAWLSLFDLGALTQYHSGSGPRRGAH